MIDQSDQNLHRYNADGTPHNFSALAGNVIDGHAGEADEVPGSNVILAAELSGYNEVEVAIAPPGSPGGSEGDIYVTNAENHEVDIFAPSGAFIAAKTLASYPCGVATDAAGNLYVANREGPGGEGIHKYTPTAPGSFTESGASPYAVEFSCQLAAAGKGFVYAAQGFTGVQKVDSEGAEEGTIDYEVTSGAGSIAINPKNGHLFATKPFDTPKRPLEEYDVSGTTEATLVSSTPLASEPHGVAVNGENDVFLTRESLTKVEVLHYEPEIELFPLSITTSGSATGTVNCEVNGGESTDVPCAAQYAEGTGLKLIPAPGAHSEFVEFDTATGSAGACAGETSCEFTVEAESSLDAVFNLIPHKLTVLPTGSGEVSATTGAISGCEEAGGVCEGTYGEGETVTLEATPGPGKKAVWTGCTNKLGNTCEIEIPASDATVEVDFVTAEPKAATVSVIGEGSVSAGAIPAPVTGAISGCEEAGGECEAEYGEGEVITLTSSPAIHHKLAWSVSGAAATTCTGTASPCTITIGTGAVSVTATSQQITHTIAITKAGTGTGTVECKFGAGAFGTCEGPHNEGEAVEVKATPAAHSTFAGFSAGSGSATACTTSPCPFTLEADSALTATFTQITHTIAITKAGTGTGTVECKFGAGAFGTCEGPHNEGEAVEVKATPAAHSTFAGFSAGSGSATACTTSPCPFPLEADSALTATFTQITHTIAITKAGTGTGTVECKFGAGAFGTCEGPHNEGEAVEVKATPAAHSTFAGFSAGSGSATACTTSPCPFTLEADSALTATFTQITHTIAITKAGTGTGTVECKFGAGAFGTCEGPHNEGEAVEVKATPAAHSTFAGFSAGSGSATACTTSPCPFPLEADSALTATFTQITHTIAITNKGTGTGAVACKEDAGGFGACNGKFNEGHQVTVKATPAKNSAFKGWSEGSASAIACNGIEAKECTFTIEADSALAATFEKEVATIEVTTAGNGTGVVACKVGTGSFGSCVGPFNKGDEITVNATAGLHSTFTGFSAGTGSAKACAGTTPCTFKLEEPSTLIATFTKITHTLAVSSAGSGSGSVTCNGAPCAAGYDEGTSITLAATASSGSTFAGFSGGGCSGTSCTLTLNADTAVTATFNANPPPVKCVVPKLAKKTLNQAKSALKKAHCTLGKVTKPKPKKGKKLGPLVVKSSQPAAGKQLAKNAKVNLKLGPKPKKGK